MYRLWANGAGDTEYFLLENRQPMGIDAALPGGGLLIYHVDERAPNNDNPNHYKVALEQADGLYQLENRYGAVSFGDAGDPYTAGQAFWRYSSPSNRSYSGDDTYVSVFGITGPGADGVVTANLHVQPGPVVDVPSVNMTELEGNGDGLVSGGETAGVFPRIAVSRKPVQDLRIHVISEDPRAVVLDADLDLGPVAAGSTLVPADPIRVRISGDLPSDPYGLPLRLELGWENAPVRRVPVELGLGTRVGSAEDFENPPLSWTHQPVRPTAVDQWTYGAAYGNHSAGFKFGFAKSGFYKGSDAALTSPPVLLPPDAELSFDSLVDIIFPDSGEVLAGGVVEISVNGGDWTVATPREGYSAFFGGANPDYAAKPVFAGEPADARFATYHVNLSEYVGSVRVRFHFFSEAESRLGLGWWIDNVAISSGNTPVRVLSASAELRGADVLLSWRLAEPLPLRVRWLAGAGAAAVHPVGAGWIPAEASGSLLDAGGAARLPAGYWLEGENRDGSVERWGPWTVTGSGVALRPWRVLANPTRGTMEFAWSVTLPPGAALEIFDVSGRLVSTRALPAVPGTAVWDGRDRNGRSAPPGIYFARISGTRLEPLRVVRLP